MEFVSSVQDECIIINDDENSNETKNDSAELNKDDNSNLLQQLKSLENITGAFPNIVDENCEKCDSSILSKKGFTLKNCLHSFCKPCLVDKINTTRGATVFCPYSFADFKCDSPLQRCEIKGIVNDDDYERYLNRASEPVNFELTENKQNLEYLALLELEKINVIKNTIDFKCAICLSMIEPGDGVILKECFHSFCQECLIHTINKFEEIDIKCPYIDQKLNPCQSIITEYEIKGLLSEVEYNKFLEKSLKLSEYKIKNTFHCRSANCIGFHIVENDDQEFHCTVCNKRNCIKCEVIHAELTCTQYQDRFKNTNLSTEVLNAIIAKREAMRCPSCGVVLTKDAGCDAIVCALCKTDICWATRGLRWGPKGKGDISGGCRCGLNGKLCTPTCQNCH